MTSNGPGMYSRFLQEHDDERDLIDGLLQDVSGSSGKFLLPVVGGFQRDIPYTTKDSGYYVSTSDGASTCSSSTAETWDLEGGALLVLETKSLRNFTTNDEYLFAMKEDLADWLSSLYQNFEITAENLFTVLETGVLLCKHANKVQEFARQHGELGETLEMRSYFIRSVPQSNVPYREEVKPATFQARDNVSNFISWTRQLGIPEVLSFETDDLVLRKNEKSVILSLLEVARIGAKLGMLAPTLVQMEQEIDAELAGEEPRPQVQIKTCDLQSLDERVRDLIGRCTCPVQFPMIKVAEGKYKIGDTRSLIFVRILHNHVMVRVGGGWDTLENYLNKHDPCQCKYRGHRSGSVGVAHGVPVSQQRISSIPNNTTTIPSDNISSSPKRVSPVAITSKQRPASPQTSSRTGSPNRMISPHIPNPPTSGSNPAKGGRVRSSQNQQQIPIEAFTRKSSSSTSNSSVGQLIRPNSPNVGTRKSHAPPTRTKNIVTQMSSSRTSSSPSIAKGQHLQQGNKSMTPRSASPRSASRLLEVDDLATDNNAYFAEDDESDNSHVGLKDNEFGSASYRLIQSSSSSLDQVLISDPISLVEEKVIVNLSSEIINNELVDLKSDVNSSLSKSKEKSCEQQDGISLGLSQIVYSFPAQILNSQELVSSTVTTKQTNLKDIDDMSQVLITSCPKIEASLSSSNCATSRLGIGEKLVSDLENSTEKDNEDTILQLPNMKKDTVTEAATVISDWLQSTNINSNQPRTQTISETPVEPCNILQKVNDTSDKDKNTEIANRIASTSRIPKPCYSSHIITPKSHGSVSKNSTKGDITMLNAQSQIDSNHYQGSINIVSMNRPLVLSKSNSNSSSIKSSEEIISSLSSTVNSNSEYSTPAISQTGRHSNVSDISNIISSNSLDHRHILVDRKNVTSATSVKNSAIKAKVTCTHEKILVNKHFPASRNTDTAPNRRTAVNTLHQNNATLLTPHTSNLDTELQATNDITFSDDEEINEIFKNSALKEETMTKNVHSSNTKTKQILHHNKKKHEEIMLINRNTSGHHSVQLVKKDQLKHDLTPKSRLMHRPHSRASSKASSPPEQAVSRTNSKTPDLTMLRQKMAPVTKSKGLSERESTVSLVSHRGVIKSRTEGYVSSTLLDNKRKPVNQLKQTKNINDENVGTDLSPTSPGDIHPILKDNKTDFTHAADGPLDPPEEDHEMYKKDGDTI